MHFALDELEANLETIDVAYADAQWREHFGQNGNGRLGRLEAARSALLLGGRVREMLDRWNGRAHDPSLARRVQLLARRFRWAEIESQPEVYELRNRVDRTILGFRPQVHGKSISRAERLRILRQHPDREHRREAWLAMGPLAAQIEADVRELMRRRENLARELGYDSFVSWALDIMALDRSWVEGLFDQLRRLTDGVYRDWLIEAAQMLSPEDGLRPWDLAFAAGRTPSLPQEGFTSAGLLPAVHALADGLGLGEEAAGVRVDLVDVPYGALCYAVRPPDDVRILLNPRDGHAYYGILFHEFGHAIHQRCLRPPSPILRRESPPFDEAMACVWERLASEPDWLTGRDGITPDQAAAYRERWAGRLVYRLRGLVAQATFEYRAYQDRAYPDRGGDLLALLQDTYAEHLGVPYDQAPGWADHPFWTSHPVYVQNYVIAEVIASQTLAALGRQFDRLIGQPQVGSWLVENYYAPGASLPWTDKVAQATGAPLNTAPLLADLGCDA